MYFMNVLFFLIYSIINQHVDDSDEMIDMMKTTLSGYLGQVVVLHPRDLIGQLVPVRAPDWSAPGCTKLSQRERSHFEAARRTQRKSQTKEGQKKFFVDRKVEILKVYVKVSCFVLIF